MHTDDKKNQENKCLMKWIDIYHSTKNPDIKSAMKNTIVTHMIPIVKRIAHTIARRANDPVDDLTQAGFIGLLKALERFKDNSNPNFRIYAGYFIIGEMKHYLRDKLNSIRVPAHIQELIIRINNFTQNLTYEELQNLTSDEVAAVLKISPQMVEKALIVDRRCSTVYLEDVCPINNSNSSFEEIIADGDYKEDIELIDAQIMLNEATKYLSKEEKSIFDMYYTEGYSQKEIAKNLNYTEMKVSRIMHNIYKKIYNYYEKITPKNS